MANNPNLEEALAKAHVSPNVGKRGEGKKTIARREAMRALYEEKLAPEFEEITDIHIQEAKKPRNYQERRDAIKRIVGEAEEGGDKHIHFHKHEELTPERRQLIEEYEAKLKELKTK